MAYASSNPPLLVQSQPIASQRKWLYVSTHDSSDVASSSHITDGRDRGMKVGDMVFVGVTTASGANNATDISTMYTHVVRTAAATAISMSAGMLVSSTGS